MQHHIEKCFCILAKAAENKRANKSTVKKLPSRLCRRMAASVPRRAQNSDSVFIDTFFISLSLYFL